MKYILKLCIYYIVFVTFCKKIVNVSNTLLSKNLKIKIYWKYNFACCFVWVWNLVADTAAGKEAEGVWEHGVEENIWT